MSIGVGQDEPRAPILPLLFEEPEPEPEQRPGRGRRGRHLAEGQEEGGSEQPEPEAEVGPTNPHSSC